MNNKGIYEDLFEGYTLRFSNGMTKCKVEMFFDRETGDEKYYATFSIGEQHADRCAKFEGEDAFDSLMTVLEVNQYHYLGV